LARNADELLAGKLHAMLSRPWLKGRDLFDLVWYLADRNWPAPNPVLLNNALKQTGWDGPLLTAAEAPTCIQSCVLRELVPQSTPAGR
jgi:hypothetical protein